MGRGETGGWPFVRAKHPSEASHSDGVSTDFRYMKFDLELEEDTSVGAGSRQRLLGQGYQDNVTIRDSSSWLR